jgi:hypothetical protein
MFRLVIVYNQTGVNHAGHPAEQREQEAKNKTQDAAGHQNRHRRQDDAEKIAERFHNQKSEVGDQRSAQRLPSVRIAASVFSKAWPGSVSPVLRNSS